MFIFISLSTYRLSLDIHNLFLIFSMFDFIFALLFLPCYAEIWQWICRNLVDFSLVVFLPYSPHYLLSTSLCLFPYLYIMYIYITYSDSRIIITTHNHIDTHTFTHTNTQTYKYTHTNSQTYTP